MPQHDGTYVEEGISKLLAVTEITFGLYENQPLADPLIYPNPALDRVTIIYSHDIKKIEICSIDERLSYSGQNLSGEPIVIETSEMEGIYLVRIFTEERIMTTRLFVL